MKKNYEVLIPITGFISVTVEAEDEDAAINAALESDDLVLENIEEWEAHKAICSGNVLHTSFNEAIAVESRQQ